MAVPPPPGQVDARGMASSSGSPTRPGVHGLWASAIPALAFSGDFVAVTVDRSLGLSVLAGLVLVGTVTAWCSALSNAATALGVAVLGWLFATGFVLDSDGVLRVQWPSGVVLLLALLAVAAAASVGRSAAQARPAARLRRSSSATGTRETITTTPITGSR